MAKKRNKKYHPKEVRTPTFLYRVWPELTPGQRAELDLIPFTHLDALGKGEGTVQSAVEVMASLRHAWVLSRGFEEKYDMRMAFLLGFAAINGIKDCLDEGNTNISEHQLAPIRIALEYLQEMKDSLTRWELLSSVRATIVAGSLFDANAHSAFYVVPEDKDWDKFLGKRGCVALNGKVRSGYLQVNENMGGRLEWVSPTEDWLTIPIDHPFVLLLTEPIEEEKNAA